MYIQNKNLQISLSQTATLQINDWNEYVDVPNTFRYIKLVKQLAKMYLFH